MNEATRTLYLDEIVRAKWEIESQRAHIKQVKKLLKQEFGMTAKEVNDEIANIPKE